MGKNDAVALFLIGEAFGVRPSALLSGGAGELAIDAIVFEIGSRARVEEQKRAARRSR
tara:strand:+ start:720 stop:893 length:174 start_codon:yes stop_codon:yes gene_type:complete